MHAVVNLDKPKGLTSRQAMLMAQKALGADKAGHAGTLDPIATGVLVVCLGEATKISGYLLELEKEYLTRLKLGERTDTFDAEGTVVEHSDNVHVTKEKIEDVLGRFRGEIEQVPPMYSAVKMSGKPLYKLARKGVEVERKPRPVRVSKLSLVGMDPPFVDIRITCSKGTYVRTLADDIGRELGTWAHIVELRRERVGHFRVQDSALPDELPLKQNAVVSPDEALAHFIAIELSEPDYRLAMNGNPFAARPYGAPANSTTLRLRGPDGEFFAVGTVLGNKIRIRRILHLKS